MEHDLGVNQSWEINLNRKQILLSHFELHKPISTPTIIWWIKTVFRLAGIDMEVGGGGEGGERRPKVSLG